MAEAASAEPGLAEPRALTVDPLIGRAADNQSTVARTMTPRIAAAVDR